MMVTHARTQFSKSSVLFRKINLIQEKSKYVKSFQALSTGEDFIPNLCKRIFCFILFAIFLALLFFLLEDFFFRFLGFLFYANLLRSFLFYPQTTFFPPQNFKNSVKIKGKRCPQGFKLQTVRNGLMLT